MSDYELVMPFVTVASKGGPHDDDSYTAGYVMGLLDMEIQNAALIHGVIKRTVAKVSQPQADLLAMRHGYSATSEDLDEFPDWVLMTFSPGEST